MLLLALSCTTPTVEPTPLPGTIIGPGYSLTVPDGVQEVLRSGLQLDLADLDGSPTIRIDEPARVPLTAADLLDDAVRVEQPDPRTVLAVGTDRGRTVFTVLKAASEDGPFIQATCTGLPADAAVLESACTSLSLDAPTPPTRHALPGVPLTVQAPHPPQPDGDLTWRFHPEGHQLSVLDITCQRLTRAPDAEAIAALVSPHGDPTPIRLPGGYAVLTEAASGMTDAVTEIGDDAGTWQCRCSSADHLWQERQALAVCLSLEAG
ncbi:MAG: hypothetical protein ACI8RZ_001305 [Myxococcota bacterium]|jgi:hypothetical protein